VIALSFALTPEFDQTVTVQPDGFVNLQSAGSLYVQDLTVPELIDSLKRQYSKVLHDPVIDVDLKDFQKPFFTVSGQVEKPGKYELRGDLTVAEALAVAGGMNGSAKSQVFLFHRASNDWFEVEKVDIRNVLNGKRLKEDATIRPGDMIYVPANFISNFKKYVPYSVSAGTYLQPNPF
jgi:polysaccharide biosynthesis/export protein